MQKPAKRVAVVGARGYSGLELVRILLRHPGVELAACFAHDKPFALSDYLPEAGKVAVRQLAELPALLPELDTVFLATPAEASLELAPKILGQAHVIDLSGAFRLQKGAAALRYAEWYGFEHPLPDLLARATYGLVPFAAPASGTHQLVANPGCYATAVLMALVPLLRAEAIDPSRITIDAKSGTTGAGRKAAENLLFTEVEGECLPYRVGKHQHLPEISEWAGQFSGAEIDPFFSTHLLPVRRGIVASLYLELLPGKDAGAVAEAFASAYRDYPLARIANLGAGQGPLLSLKKVAGTARVHISYQVSGSKLYLFSLIDNLLKGAASQAVENFNRLYDFPPAYSLEGMEGTL